jgi:phospholipase/lecithinase/hemolysin
MYANVAAATGAILISNLVKFCYSSGNPVTTSTSLMADVVHPNQKGMHYIANKIIDFMQQRYSKPSITLQSPRYGITITPTYYSTPITLVERDTQ